MSTSLARIITSAVLLPLIVCTTAVAQTRDPLRAVRYEMVRDYIEREGIKNLRVLMAMRQVPRHEFVRPTERARAYFDEALPIGYQQTISPPFIVAYMTEAIDPQESDRVLEIGTGSGYQAAVLSGLVKEVYTIEIVDGLGKTAARVLSRLGYDNVQTKIGDGYKGWPEHAPFDKIIVTCSPESVPKPLVEQLKEGGKMIIPLGERYQQVFHLFEKRDGELVQTRLISTLFVPMTGISEEQRTVQPDPLNPQIANGGFEIDDNDDGRPDSWHYQRQTRLVDEEAREGERYVCFENSEPGRLAQALQGMPLDGRKVAALDVSVWAKHERTASGPQAFEKPAFVVHFYDSVRRPIGEEVLGPWLGSGEWRRYSAEMKVPRTAREAIVRIGLNGATGQLCADDIRLVAKPR